MDATQRIEQALANALECWETNGIDPPRLAAAMRHAVFPGGARIRPRLCLAIAAASGDPDPDVTEAAAAAIELMHCASLVHDDLPCFDNARTRRGLPSVHAAFGERIAVLTGDAL
ncbi:MAG: polyprenyl synthetase family protein, partial [Betaproteobacteria bacterium]